MNFTQMEKMIEKAFHATISQSFYFRLIANYSSAFGEG